MRLSEDRERRFASFREWLTHNTERTKGPTGDAVARAKRVERALPRMVGAVNLDGEYAGDRLETVLQLLTYSTADEHNCRRPPWGLDFMLDPQSPTYYRSIREGLSSLRSAVELYAAFCAAVPMSSSIRGTRTVEEYLSEEKREQVPGWLASYRKGDAVPLKEFLHSRTVFYPGSWFDTRPMKTFGLSGAAHAFVYVDYDAEDSHSLTQTNFPRIFRNEFSLEGYGVYDMVLFGRGEMDSAIRWRPHLEGEELREAVAGLHGSGNDEQYSYFIVLERDADHGDDYEPDRLALWFILGDGIATFDALYANRNASAPFALIQRDHGWGANYSTFANGGLMHRIAQRGNVHPEFILFGNSEEEKVWDGYAPVEGVRREEYKTLLRREAT